jgi:hypothetical protein
MLKPISKQIGSSDAVVLSRWRMEGMDDEEPGTPSAVLAGS